MEALPFYRGNASSISEIIALEGQYRTDSLIVRINDCLALKREHEFSHAEMVVASITELEDGVNMDGFATFFENQPTYLDHCEPALKEVGAPLMAEILRQARTAHPEVLDELTEDFIAYPDPLKDLLWDYVKANKAAFNLQLSLRPGLGGFQGSQLVGKLLRNIFPNNHQ